MCGGVRNTSWSWEMCGGVRNVSRSWGVGNVSRSWAMRCGYEQCDRLWYECVVIMDNASEIVSMGMCGGEWRKTLSTLFAAWIICEEKFG
ncbi:hypothetical protein AVEN_94872-1 [Araneus ventricosus]|uniref:Uncharacterized protein n=1 Tax=Araneus ventricosus TaxID=182803 RepID=A0A4Y2IAL4_ARAVE|nr:hypothetical protein AVEN_94872-1 [Araneus ventricosus]